MPVTVDDLDGARTIAQAAELLGYSYRHMQRVVASGAIDYIRLGDGSKGRVLITQRAITDYLNRNDRAARRADQAARRRAGDQ